MAELQVSEQLRRNYADYYSGEETAWRRLGAIDKAANVATLAHGVPHATVLEIGAGEGALLRRLAELGFGDRYWALEISPSGLETIRRSGVPGLEDCRLFDGYEVPFSAQAFDLAVLSHVVEHVEYPRKLLYEAARVARCVVVEVPLEDNVRLSRDFVFDKVGHINFYSPKTIRRLLQSCGFEVLAERVTNPSRASYLHRPGGGGRGRYRVKQLLLRAWPSLATRLFTYHGAFLCRSPRPRVGV
jgi:ubiquinone/menaquinone biosynthesis C-methylase UbiE